MLLILPHLVHRLHIVSRQLANVAVRARHRQELAISTAASAITAEVDFARGELHAGLAQRSDNQSGRLVIAHPLPVFSASVLGHTLTGLLSCISRRSDR